MTVTRMLWGFIENRDHRVMRQMNRWRAPRWFRIWMILSTRLGDGWLWYGVGIMLLAWGGPQRLAAVGAAGSAALVGVLIFKALKHLSHRMRPCQFEPHCWSKVLPPDKFSFPSGHTMTAFSIALVLSYFYPALEGTLFFLAMQDRHLYRDKCARPYIVEQIAIASDSSAKSNSLAAQALS